MFLVIISIISVLSMSLIYIAGIILSLKKFKKIKKMKTYCAVAFSLLLVAHLRLAKFLMQVCWRPFWGFKWKA